MMNKEKRNLNKGKRIGKWEIFGFLTGFVGIVLSIALLCLWEYAEHENRHVILPFVLALNLLASIIWLCGISLNEIKFLVVSLLWWAIPLLSWAFYLTYCAVHAIRINLEDKLDGGYRDFWGHKNRRRPNNISLFDTVAIPITVFAVMFYIVAMVTYIEVKEEIARKYPPICIIHPKPRIENKEDA